MIHTYESVFEVSQRIAWKIEDVIGGDKRLDFTKPFLPESLAQVEGLSFLTRAEKLKLNQIRAVEYLSIFEMAEESIVPHLLDYICPELSEYNYRVGAVMGFAGEEVKHIQLFKRFREEFEEGFGTKCDFVGPVDQVTKFVLSHSPLGVALAVHHFEWMSLSHYLESVKDNQDLDPQFKSLLKHHWLEESQHVKIGTLMIKELAEQSSPEEIDKGIADYLAIIGFLGEILKRQANLNIDNFAGATKRLLYSDEYRKVMDALLGGMRWTYIGSAWNSPNFCATLEAVKPDFSLAGLMVTG